MCSLILAFSAGKESELQRHFLSNRPFLVYYFSVDNRLHVRFF